MNIPPTNPPAAHATAGNQTCPLCQTNLDVNQDKLISQKAAPYKMPVFYISDLIGLAAGADFGNKLWRKRFVDPRELLNRYALA
jgi:heterodisulfide reductase subunit B